MSHVALDGLPLEAAHAARETLGGAVAVARQFSDFGAAFLDTARAGFTTGLRVTALASALIMLGMAVLVTRTLRAGGR